jgi:hypothetical protein
MVNRDKSGRSGRRLGSQKLGTVTADTAGLPSAARAVAGISSARMRLEAKSHTKALALAEGKILWYLEQ